jgi:hypothetical protein
MNVGWLIVQNEDVVSEDPHPFIQRTRNNKVQFPHSLEYTYMTYTTEKNMIVVANNNRVGCCGIEYKPR